MNKHIRESFTLLMKLIQPSFRFPRGGIATKTVNRCLDGLQNRYPDLCRPRIVDFCICQVYAISRFDAAYLRKWNVTHSFGEKAMERYFTCDNVHKRCQDRWLREYQLDRNMLYSLLQERSRHPLYKFIFPEYEEGTKRRMLGTPTGYYICQVSTLLWTPYSAVCRACRYEEKCKEATRQKYCELFRIRVEEYNDEKRHGNVQ